MGTVYETTIILKYVSRGIGSGFVVLAFAMVFGYHRWNPSGGSKICTLATYLSQMPRVLIYLNDYLKNT